MARREPGDKRATREAGDRPAARQAADRPAARDTGVEAGSLEAGVPPARLETRATMDRPARPRTPVMTSPATSRRKVDPMVMPLRSMTERTLVARPTVSPPIAR